MKATLVTVVGMTALMSSGAISAPLNTAQIAGGSNNAENVRLVCNEYGHCWRSRGPRYVVRDYDNYRVRRSYGYYGDGPRYHGGDGYYGGGPSIGLSFGNRGW